MVEAVNNKDFLNLKEELGDLLLQVVMYSEIAKEQDEFTIEEVIDCAASKMVKRHPHVFNDGLNGEILEYDAVNISHWNQIKLKEKQERLKEYEKLYHQGKISIDLLELQQKKLENYQYKLGIITKK